jgi:PadR family transcriptional regulator, regulatory protein AphA
MSSGLTTFSYVILALVGQGGAGAHDLVESQRRAGSPYWFTSRRNMYAEPKRLAGLGYLSATREPGRTHDRTVYELTDRGKQALREWVAQPTRFPRIQSEAPVRLVAGYLVADEQLLDSLRALHAELDAVSAGLDEAERYAATLPHRERYLRLVHSLGRHLLDAHQQWLKEVERELG